MFAKILIVSLVSLSLLGLFPQRGEADPLQIVPLTPKEYITLYAKEYGANEQQLLKVAYCESQYNPNAIHINDGGKGKHSVGIFQYQESTFNQFDDLMKEDLDYYSYEDQIKLTAYVFAKYPKLKRHWTCARILKIA